MRRFEIQLMTLSTLVVGVTGIALYLLKNWVTNPDPFAIVQHPAQPWMLRIHLISIPVLIFAAGLIFADHAVNRLRAGKSAGRQSGIGMLAMLAPMIFSGVLIQMLSVESWVRIAVWVHLITGTIYMLGFLFHRLRHRRSARLRRAKKREFRSTRKPNRSSSVLQSRG